MATLQLRNGSYRLLFCYGDKRYSFTLGKVDKAQADAKAATVEETLALIDRGRLKVPEGVDLVEFVKKDGRVEEKAAKPHRAAAAPKTHRRLPGHARQRRASSRIHSPQSACT